MVNNIIIRCDGSPEIGMGHVFRCLELAHKLKSYNYTAIFALRFGIQGEQIIKTHGFKVITAKTKGFNYGIWLDEIADDTDAVAFIFDCRDGLENNNLKSLSRRKIVLVSIDDNEKKRLECDLVFYPPIPQVEQMNWNGFAGELFSGWEYVILRDEFQKNYIKKKSKVPQLLISMGGSDPYGFTSRILSIIAPCFSFFNIRVILGPLFTEKTKIKNKYSNNIEILENPLNIAEIMAQSDLAIASFGVTAYELVAMNVPSFYICISEDHANSASVFELNGCAVVLGIHNKITDNQIHQKLKKLLFDNSLHEQMRLNCKKINIEKGSDNICSIINRKIRDLHAQ